MELVDHLKDELSSIRAEIRDINSTISRYMSEQSGAVSKLTEKALTAEKNVTALWDTVNTLDKRCDMLNSQIQSIEGRHMGAGKIISIIFAACGAVAAVVALLK
jgi:predicted  nucleic acid-binding Zn-ribbon protein